MLFQTSYHTSGNWKIAEIAREIDTGEFVEDLRIDVKYKDVPDSMLTRTGFSKETLDNKSSKKESSSK